jgi:hypothetical protein
MVCDAARLTCAVLEVAEALRGGPTLFEVLSQVVVPLVLGVATLVVAFLSFRVARQATTLTEQSVEVARQSVEVARQAKDVAERSTQAAVDSHELSEQIRRDAVDERLQAERDKFAADLTAWVEEEILLIDKTPGAVPGAAAIRELEVETRSHAVKSPNALKVVASIHEFLDFARTNETPYDKGLWVRGRTAWAIRAWQSYPTVVLALDEDATSHPS